MKKRNVFIWVVTVLWSFVGIAQNHSASVDTIKRHVYYLASEELKGRNTGYEGQKMAAEYIAEQFKRYGVATFSNSGYYHYYSLSRLYRNEIFVKGGGSVMFWPWHFYYVTGYNHQEQKNTNLVFVGYGSDKDLEPLSINGNAVALVAKSPGQAFDVIKNIASNYSCNTFFVIFPKRDKDVSIAWGNHYQMSGYDLPYKFENRKLQIVKEEWNNFNDSLNVFYCFPNVLKNLFMLSDDELLKVANNNVIQNYSLLPSIMKPQINYSINYIDSVETMSVENVCGYIKGNDTTKTLVLSAHYDHVGEDQNGINYGADDNASGTAALLETARLMAIDAQNGKKPEVNVLFVAFSGEELGLLGSKSFVRDTNIALNEIKLNVNMDMLGRWDEKHNKNKDFVYLLTAGEQSKALYGIGKKNIDLPKGFDLSFKPGAKEKMVFKYGSDHHSFYEKDISVAIFFTGLHDDYHTPGDTPDKINYTNLTNITNIVYQYVYKAAELIGKESNK